VNRSFIGFGRSPENPKQRPELPEDLARDPLVRLMVEKYPYDPAWRNEQSIRSFLAKVHGTDENVDDAGHERSGKTSDENRDFELLNSNSAWQKTKRL
jgi:hypothetical protein